MVESLTQIFGSIITKGRLALLNCKLIHENHIRTNECAPFYQKLKCVFSILSNMGYKKCKSMLGKILTVSKKVCICT